MSSVNRNQAVQLNRQMRWSFLVTCLCLLAIHEFAQGFVLSPLPQHARNWMLPGSRSILTPTLYNNGAALGAMKRPILDQIASTLFDLETKRVKDSSVIDEQGRMGEPMEWSTSDSLANKLSEFMAQGPGYQFKQFVADIVAGEHDEAATQQYIDQMIAKQNVIMFSFTTCPFCRRAKDLLEEQNIRYATVELDELPDNQGNEIRASLGKMTKRTSVPNIFIRQSSIGGLNDGNPGLVPLFESGELLNRIKK
jgi:glutaredoxin 3